MSNLFKDLYRANDGDVGLLISLGLRTTDFQREFTDLGTVIVEEAEPDGEYGPKPASTVKVEVAAMPAQFWRFTVTRPQDNSELVNGKVRGIYEPVEIFILSTGSGRFSEYWPIAKRVAENMLDIKQVQ